MLDTREKLKDCLKKEKEFYITRKSRHDQMVEWVVKDPCVRIWQYQKVFYFSQCIASLERTVIEKDQTNKNRILSDPYFMKVLQVEKEEQRIHKIDYWLLKRKWIDLYYGLHKRYAKLKKYK